MLLSLFSLHLAIEVPPVQTQQQQALWAKQNSAAATASAAATPKLLAFFGQDDFRKELAKCCPSVAALPSEELLARFREEVLVTELAHNFPSAASSDPHSHHVSSDETIAIANEYPWFINGWQARLLPHNASLGAFDPRRTSRTAFSMSDAEVGIFGCAPFAKPDQPTWEEAANRLIYVAHNLRQRDTGSSFHFGDVSAIFRRSSVDHLVLIAPVDTGIWEGSCNATDTNPWKDLNCSYWQSRTVATFNHFDHMLLGNLGSWAGGGQSHPALTLAEQAARLFARTAFGGAYDSLPELATEELEQYWESNVVGNPRLDAVKFVIPLFGALFGTSVGETLQALGLAKGWPLVWSLGDGTSGGHGQKTNTTRWPANQRLLDLPTAAKLTNMSASAEVNSAFQAVWEEASADRARLPQGQPPSVATVQGWWQKLLSAGVPRLAPLSARACVDVDRCVGVTIGGKECVCHSS